MNRLLVTAMPLSSQDIESELSYAFLHAISSKAGASCKPGSRHDDNSGVDAEVNFRGEIDHPYLKDVQINIQLKATTKNPGSASDYLSYFIQGVDGIISYEGMIVEQVPY